MIDQNADILKVVYVIMAAIAGSVTALAFLRWKEMTWPEISLTLFVGASFAIFVTPWLAHSWFGLDTGEVRAVAALTYVTASGSNTLLPVLIRWMRRSLGENEVPK